LIVSRFVSAKFYIFPQNITSHHILDTHIHSLSVASSMRFVILPFDTFGEVVRNAKAHAFAESFALLITRRKRQNHERELFSPFLVACSNIASLDKQIEHAMVLISK
jgi:hypothetical protein